MSGGPIQRYETSTGRVIYKLPVLAFPTHVTNCYLVPGGPVTLIDTGSGLRFSNEGLEEAIGRVASEFGEDVSLEKIEQIILTHGHIDHFGGLNFALERSGARLGVHPLDVGTVQFFEERLIVSARNLHIFLTRAGLTETEADEWVEKNKWSKNMFRAVKVDFTFGEGDTIAGGFRVHHAPGHCPGQVCLGLDDILFTADHVLARTTPNQSPESIIRYNGLGHYYDALEHVREMIARHGYRLGLGGHEEDIADIPGRIGDIIAFHDRRLARVLEICKEPKSIRQISAELFPKAREYHVLLAMTEAGAHVEYLHERGRLVVVNIEEVEQNKRPVLLYQIS